MKLQIITTAALLTLGSTLGFNQARAEGTPPPPPPPPAGEHPGRGPGGGGGGGMRMKAEERMKMLAEELGLSEAQKAKLGPIIKAEAEELRAIMQNESLDRRDKMEKARAVREAYKPKIRAELTPEQITKLDAWEKNHPGRGPRGERGERKGPPPPAQ